MQGVAVKQGASGEGGVKVCLVIHLGRRRAGWAKCPRDDSQVSVCCMLGTLVQCVEDGGT